MGRRIWVIVFVLVLGLVPGLGHADNGAPAVPYFDTAIVDLTALLPPPPASDSPETKAELGDLLVIQIARTPDMVARAQADAVEEVWRFADVLGPKFNAESLPKTAALFERLVATDNAVLEPAKSQFSRQRPYMVSDLVKPVVKPSTSGSWPSSHASLGTLMGIILADMLPEKRMAIMTRAQAYAENRLVAGAHFPSDVEMGRVSGTVIANAALHQATFIADFAASKTELRATLGLE